MSRSARTITFVADAITVEGALIGPAMLGRVAAQQEDDQTDDAYRVPKGLTLRDEIARYFRIGQALFTELNDSPAPSARKTVGFVEALFRDVFGFSDITRIGTHTLDGRVFAVSLEGLGGRVPVVVVPPGDELDRPSNALMPDGRRRSAASALQDWLNASEDALWGLCCNGERLRLLRDNASLTRPAYIEADLRRIFEDENFADFTALWLLLHVSRFGASGTAVSDCALERWREASQREGLVARDRLRDGVEAALLALGTGFLAHEMNGALRDRLQAGTLPLPDFFGQLLRLIYRLIFLLTAEDRELLHPPGTSLPAKKLYAEGYSVGLLRDRAVRRNAWDRHHDRWEGLLITFAALARGEPRLGLPALGGLFAADTIPDLEAARLTNKALMEATYRLAWLRENSALFQVNWRDMETEELGSVYESLLELTPTLVDDGRALAFAEGGEARGHARKTTGSYYTPDALVQALLDSALDPVLDRVEAEADDPAAALLGVSVIDPACGSGHFLLAAGRRIATRLARTRAGGVASAEDFRRALRDVARACLHGVDRNPMAVELTKVALWIETVEPGKPLGFLDANVRCGDALLGVFDIKALGAGIPDAAYKPLTGDDRDTAKYFERVNKAERGGQGSLDFAGGGGMLPPMAPLAEEIRALRALPEDSQQEIADKSFRFSAARSSPQHLSLRVSGDLYIAAFLAPKMGDGPGKPDVSKIPTTANVWRAASGHVLDSLLIHRSEELSQEARAFHWPLEFPDVMASGGFDVVLGNPPWERIKLQEQEFFAAREPEIAKAPNAAARRKMIKALKEAAPGTRQHVLYEEFETAKRIAEAASAFARVPGEDQGRFPLTGRGDVNTYSLFAELFSSLMRRRSRAGVVVPTGIAINETTSTFFSSIVAQKRLLLLQAFDEIKNWFSGTKDNQSFCIFVLSDNSDNPRFVFQIANTNELKDDRRVFQLSPEEIVSLNPNTKTASVFRSRADAALTKKIYSRLPVLINEAKGPAGNPWGIGFMRMFDMSNDSGLFRTAAQLRAEGYVREGADWTTINARHRYVPLYESKMIHQFDHRFGYYPEGKVDDTRALPRPNLSEKQDPSYEVMPRYWVPLTDVEHRLVNKKWSKKWLIGWRDITNSTNERTVICGASRCVGFGDKFLLLLPAQPEHAVPLIGALNSLVLDYCSRQKLVGTSFKYFLMKQLPVPPPSAFSDDDLKFIRDRVLELTYTSDSMTPFARDLGYQGPPFGWAEGRRAQLRAELDAWYARSYGLSRDELRYILDPEDPMGAGYPSETFRVLKNNDIRRFGEYRTAKLVLDAWDRMERGEIQDVAAPSAARVATHIPVTIDFSVLADGIWANPSPGVDATLAQFAALIKALPGATPVSQVRLAMLYALEPRYLIRHLSPADRTTWRRLVGPETEPISGATVAAFTPSINAGWRDAVTQLRGMRAIIEDTESQTWAAGPAIDEFEIDLSACPWGRATFVLKALNGINVDEGTRDLPIEDRNWVNADAA